MEERIYAYRGGHYCDGCIVPEVLETPRYGRWALLTNFTPSEDADSDLAEMAEDLKVNRSTVNSDTFPVEVSQPPEPPTFCPGCLNFFSLPTIDTEEYL